MEQSGNRIKKWVVNFYLDDDLVVSGNIEASSKDVAEMNAEIELMHCKDIQALNIKWNRVETSEVIERLGEFGDDEGW